MKLKFVLSMILSVFMGTACSTIAKQVQPKVELSQVGVKDVGVKGATILFGLKVQNPNSFSLRVDGLRYDLQLGGKAFTSGTLEKGAEIPAGETTVVEIPVAVNYTDVFSSMAQFIRDGTTTYKLSGSAKFGFFDVPFAQDGKLDLNP